MKKVKACQVTIRLINKCLWCDEVNIPMDKMLCYIKFLKAINKAVTKQCGKDYASYDIDDVNLTELPSKKGVRK